MITITMESEIRSQNIQGNSGRNKNEVPIAESVK
jgi:hypothetical protein